ncbi:hypothetical protein [Streptomyces sp. NPDC050507]|uniref:DUF6197 family protein n=1 Tax=Streptomyces sp. NPDC050507 TaxID=3365619 RepID=UPI0037B4047B
MTTPTDEAKTIADLFDKAARLLEEKGWTQGAFKVPETGAMCARGALYEAQGCEWERSDLPGGDLEPRGFDWSRAHAINDTLTDYVPNEYGFLPHWNDDEGRTAKEVTALLRDVARGVRTNGSNGKASRCLGYDEESAEAA